MKRINLDNLSVVTVVHRRIANGINEIMDYLEGGESKKEKPQLPWPEEHPSRRSSE